MTDPSPPRRVHLACAAFGVGLAALLGACATTREVDAAALERELRTRLAAAEDVEESAVSVSCPEGVEAITGTEFECRADVAGADPVRISVTLTSDDGDVLVDLVGDVEPRVSAP